MSVILKLFPPKKRYDIEERIRSSSLGWFGQVEKNGTGVNDR